MGTVPLTEDELASALTLEEVRDRLKGSLTIEQIRRRSRKGTFCPLVKLSHYRAVVKLSDWQEYLAGRREWPVGSSSAGECRVEQQGD